MKFKFITQADLDALPPAERAAYSSDEYQTWLRHQWARQAAEDAAAEWRYLDWDYERSPHIDLCNGDFNS